MMFLFCNCLPLSGVGPSKEFITKKGKESKCPVNHFAPSTTIFICPLLGCHFVVYPLEAAFYSIKIKLQYYVLAVVQPVGKTRQKNPIS